MLQTLLLSLIKSSTYTKLCIYFVFILFLGGGGGGGKFLLGEHYLVTAKCTLEKQFCVYIALFNICSKPRNSL